ncbi:hypothetical protein [Azorhizobium sp. AG788]|uniref:hypothetical protein n=1 Tax=Azorhizobium sp. AG788 TaxID=2183897 RepID=UPI00313915C2
MYRKALRLCYSCCMASAKTTSRKADRSPSAIGRARFEKISAVEGIRTSAATTRMFAEFDRKGLTAEERRRAIFEKHAKKSSFAVGRECRVVRVGEVSEDDLALIAQAEVPTEFAHLDAELKDRKP